MGIVFILSSAQMIQWRVLNASYCLLSVFMKLIDRSNRSPELRVVFAGECYQTTE
jgi:hypothetical protein